MNTKTKLVSNTPLFTESKHFYSDYIVSSSKFHTEFTVDLNLALPLVVDTEYVAPSVEKVLSGEFTPRQFVTTQIKHIHHDDAAIYVHPLFKSEHPDKTFRHPVLNHPFVIGDYLESKGHDVTMRRYDKDDTDEAEKPMLLAVLYAHFALADIGMLFTDGDWLEDLTQKFARRHIEMSRRLTCGRSGRVPFNWIISIDGFEYRIALKIIDTVAVHGQASYLDFCANSGVVLDAKDKMKSWITKMDQAYFEVPEDFDDYSLGDLRVYDALVGNAENVRVVWRDLGIESYYKPPKLSIGSTVAALFEAKVFQLFDVSPEEIAHKNFKKDDFLKPLTGNATATALSELVKSNAFTLSKCDGGRCKSNNPILAKLECDGVDIDIAGAYAGGMSQMLFPFGTPTIYATPFDRTNNKGVALKTVLTAFKNELVPKLWLMRIQVKGLSYEQDLISSWDDFARSTVKTIDGEIIGQVDLETGYSKNFTTEIYNGALTSDLLDVIDQWNPRHRDDFYSKCEVLAIAFYPSSLQLSVEEFKATTKTNRFTSNSRAVKEFQQITQENHYWCAVPLGEFFTDILLAKRKQHPKKSALNTLYKLFANTSYGDSVSRYFGTSNMIVGNNITAIVRSFMWLSEKSLNLCGSITDGQVFDLDNVLFRKDGKYLKTEALARLYSIPKWQFSNSNCGEFRSLLRNKRTCNYSTDNEAKNDLNNDALAVEKYRQDTIEIDRAALEHVGNVWTESKLLHGEYNVLTPVDGHVLYTKEKGLFRFEMKEFTDLAVLHGSSNYSFDPTDAKRTKMRSYEANKLHLAFTCENDELSTVEEFDGVSPAQTLFAEILKNPHSVRRLPPFIKSAILKPAAFANDYQNKWEKTNYRPGDNIIKIGKLNYFSLAAFTYKTREQYQNWKKANDKLKRKYGESFEIFYTNEDDTIDYQQMIDDIDTAIRNDVINPIRYFDKHRNRHRIEVSPTGAAYLNATKLLKKEIAALYVSEDYEEYDLIDDSGE